MEGAGLIARPAPAARRWMIALSVLLTAGQIADMVWPRDDPRAGSPGAVLFAVALFLLLALYPTGRPVPRGMSWVAGLASVLFAASVIAGPDVAARFLWPLPLAPLLLLLVIGGQGYRYWRRSSAAERETVRWPLLGVLLLLTLVLPADIIALGMTGGTISDPAPILAAITQLGFLFPAVGFLAGMLSPATELVDQLLALWITFVLSAAVLGALFAGGMAVAGLVLHEPAWSAVVGAGVAVLAGVWVVPAARRVAQRIAFGGRRDVPHAVAGLTRRLRTTMDPAEIPVHVVEAVRESTGAVAVQLRRSGRTAVWAQAGEPATEHQGSTEAAVTHLGLPVATLTVWPRAAETALASADLRLIDALAASAAPALHGARLASAFPELTEREQQVLAGITRGLPNAAIAARLGVSGKTVANYVSIVLTKLRVPDKERAAELARRRAAELD